MNINIDYLGIYYNISKLIICGFFNFVNMDVNIDKYCYILTNTNIYAVYNNLKVFVNEYKCYLALYFLHNWI